MTARADRPHMLLDEFEEPDGVRDEGTRTVPLGLPDPVGVQQDTEPLKTWVR